MSLEDESYQTYVAFCRRLHQRPLPREAWRELRYRQDPSMSSMVLDLKISKRGVIT